MEIGIKHWFSVLSLAVLLHAYAVLHVNLTGHSAESVHSFDQYMIDLTTLASPPKQIKLEPFIPPPPRETRPPETKPEPEVKPPEPKPKPKPRPEPEKSKVITPEAKQPKVVVPEFEQPVQKTEVEPAESSPPPTPAHVPEVKKALPENTSAATPKPGARAKKADYGYYQLILDRLERLKRYPSRARQRGEQGTVVLSFTLNRDGSLKHYKIRQSSGSRTLDLEVKKLIKRAAPFPAVPENISTDTLELSVPISFALH